jgi:hypothetical protein
MNNSSGKEIESSSRQKAESNRLSFQDWGRVILPLLIASFFAEGTARLLKSQAIYTELAQLLPSQPQNMRPQASSSMKNLS